ncbi:hypothetical protein AWC17_26770 [Mycobacterium nebraskense]|uniref:Uncharacterized protein n=3 Tax=Mycobacterium TaxID=1763 RepID=A0A1X1ZXS8_9MYCO|nr:hypothetical protein ABW17_24710 [Mycobacterium nebraskense]ORV25838.1 hypothetical protein AWB97_01000 [Mycobacterium intracellulare subsp. chimaera]ORW29680.1 hypothetical protein AWC17_26770 [Mycobacterium nebraskense]
MRDGHNVCERHLMSDHSPTGSSCPTTYRLLQGFRASFEDGPLRQRLSGQPEWHMYDDHAGHLASFRGDSTDAIRSAMRLVMDRGDFGTGDWFLVASGEYEFRLNNVGIALRAEALRRREGMDHGGE